MRQYWTSCVLIAVLLMGCSTTRVDLDSERARLLELDEEWSAAVAGSDVEAMVACLADDIYVAPSGFGAVTGKQAVREYVLAFQTPRENETKARTSMWSSTPLPMECKTRDLRFSPDGNLAYMLQSNTLSISGDAAFIAKYGHGTKVWRKQPDGAWKCVVYSWSGSGESALGYWE